MSRRRVFSHDRLRVECSSQTPRVDGRRGRVSRVRTAESYRECASRRAFLNRIALALAPRVCEHTRVQSAESARGTCLKPTRVRYPQTHHTLYASFHSSEGPRKPKPVSQSHSRFSRRFGRHLLQSGLSSGLKSYHSQLTPASCGGTSTRARAFHTWNLSLIHI